MSDRLPVLPDDAAAAVAGGTAAATAVAGGTAAADGTEGTAAADGSARATDENVAAAEGPAVVGEVVGAEGESGPAGDPFPRERFVGLVGRLPRYLRLAWGLAGEPRLSAVAKTGVLAAAAYLASPIDAIPGVIPVVGQLDDIAVALFALRAALRSLDPATRERQLAAAGLAHDDLDRDLGTLAVTAAWLARRGIVIGRRLGALALTASVAAGRAGAGVVRRGAPVVARTTAGAVRRGAPVVADGAGRAARAGAGAARAAGGAARTGAGAMAGAAGRGLGGFRVRVLRRGAGAGTGDPADDPTGAPDRDAGSGI